MGYSGLGIARCLRGQGVRVIALHPSPHPFGTGSRLLRILRSPDSRNEPARLCEYLVALARRLGARPVLFPTRDLDVVFINDHRRQLDAHYRIAQPDAERLDRVINKFRITVFATAAGVPVPRTVSVTPDAPTAIPADMRFPLIVKSVYAHEMRLGDRWTQAGGLKGFRVDNEAELHAMLERLLPLGVELFVQEYIPGPVDHLVICGGYVGRNGELLGHFTARKRIQEPVDAGTGIAVETIHRPDLVEITRRLLTKLELVGFFEAEYKLDADNCPRLIEVNPRHWDQHLLGMGCGINLTLLAYRDLTGESVPPMMPQRRRACWVADPDRFRQYITGRVPLRVFGGGESDDPPRRILCAAWDPGDPVPAVVAYGRIVRELAQAVCVRAFRHVCGSNR